MYILNCDMRERERVGGLCLGVILRCMIFVFCIFTCLVYYKVKFDCLIIYYCDWAGIELEERNILMIYLRYFNRRKKYLRIYIFKKVILKIIEN